jgi:pyrrolidone-carboxylate peptidase
MLGVAAARHRLTPEFFARNAIGKAKDVCGESRFGIIDANFPLLMTGTLWTAPEVAEWTMELPVQASFDAGSYLCNYLYFRALERFPNKEIGFLHVPGEDKLPLEEQKKTLDKVIAFIG